MKYFLLFSSMALAIIGQYFLKIGINNSSLSPNLISIIKTITSTHVLLGFISYGVSSVIWLFVLQSFPLSVAYPALSITYVVIIFISYYFLKEPINPIKILGAIFITIGVYLIFQKSS